MPQSFVVASMESNSPSRTCGGPRALVRGRGGLAEPHPLLRSDMTEVEWRESLPVPARLQGGVAGRRATVTRRWSMLCVDGRVIRLCRASCDVPSLNWTSIGCAVQEFGAIAPYLKRVLSR